MFFMCRPLLLLAAGGLGGCAGNRKKAVEDVFFKLTPDAAATAQVTSAWKQGASQLARAGRSEDADAVSAGLEDKAKVEENETHAALVSGQPSLATKQKAEDTRLATLVQFLAELGDSNWVVICFLAAWCPVWGMRLAVGRWKEAALVWVGAGLALLARFGIAFLLSGGSHSWVDLGLRLAASLLLCCLTLKAFADYTAANESARLLRQQEQEAREKTEASEAPAPTYATNVFQVPAPASVAGAGLAGRAAEEGDSNPFTISGDQAHSSAEAALASKAGRQSAAPLAVALLVPFVATLLVACSRPLHGGELSQLETTPVSTVLGSILAALVAVVAGNFFERFLSDRRFLLLAWFAIGLQALVTTNHFLLRHVFDLQTPTLVVR